MRTNWYTRLTLCAAFAGLLALVSSGCSSPAGGGYKSTKAITGFRLAGVTGTISGATIYVKNIPLYTDNTETTLTDLTDIAPGIDHNGVSVNPASGSKQDFRGLVKTYTVTAEDGSTAVYTVIVSLAPLTGTGGISGYIDKADDLYGGSATDEPIPLPVNITLSTDWTGLLSAIQSKGKYVALDLSACTGAAEFDPGAANTGESKIVSLVLPDGRQALRRAHTTTLPSRTLAPLAPLPERA
jgi:hypothetical protein